MKSNLLLIIAIIALFFSGPLSAQSKKELKLENDSLKLLNATLEAKNEHSANVITDLRTQLNEKSSEAEKLARELLMLEEYFISRFDTTKIDSAVRKKAIAWNDTVVHAQKKMIDLESEFIDVIVDGKEEAVIKDAYKKYIAFLYKTEIVFRDMKPFDEKDTFREALLDLLKAFISVAEEEYAEMVMIYTKEADLLTDEDFERWEELTNIVDEKEGLANDIFILKQKIFAAEYHFTLLD